MRDGLIVDEYGNRRWYVNDQLHRTDGPAVEWASGAREWWLNGQRHRTNGPAIKFSGGTREWWLNGRRHRTDGPAIEWWDETCEWWMNNKSYTFQEWLKINNKLTAQQKTVLMLKYADK